MRQSIKGGEGSMKRVDWSKKKAIITLALCAILAVSSIMLLQMNQTTQAALIQLHS